MSTLVCGNLRDRATTHSALSEQVCEEETLSTRRDLTASFGAVEPA
jgi:hypothetical protein